MGRPRAEIDVRVVHADGNVWRDRRDRRRNETGPPVYVRSRRCPSRSRTNGRREAKRRPCLRRYSRNRLGYRDVGGYRGRRVRRPVRRKRLLFGVGVLSAGGPPGRERAASRCDLRNRPCRRYLSSLNAKRLRPGFR